LVDLRAGKKGESWAGERAGHWVEKKVASRAASTAGPTVA